MTLLASIINDLEDLENNVRIGVTNCLYTHGGVVLVLIRINSKMNVGGRINSSSRQCIHYSISLTTLWAHKWRTKSRFLYIDIVPRLLCLRSNDDVTIDCLTLVMTVRRHNCEARTRKVIVNLINVDVIHGDIHGRCEKFRQTQDFIHKRVILSNIANWSLYMILIAWRKFLH